MGGEKCTGEDNSDRTKHELVHVTRGKKKEKGKTEKGKGKREEGKGEKQKGREKGPVKQEKKRRRREC